MSGCLRAVMLSGESSEGEDGVPLDEEHTIEPEPVQLGHGGERGITCLA